MLIVKWPAGRAARAVMVALALLTAVGVAAVLGVRVNTTPSLPRGLYVAAPLGAEALRRGDWVAACPDTAAVRRLGRYWTNGRCSGGVSRPDGVRPLAKPIGGIPGDTVLVERSGVSINGSQLPNSAPLERDRAGRPVAPQYGVQVLREGEYWLHSGRVAASIDSRYTGPVRNVRERIRPLWTER